jgi:hypothetical protein
MGHWSIAAYAPKPGFEEKLLEIVKSHWSVLHGQGLVTEKIANIMRATDGTIVEVFEWVSEEAIEAAHENPVVIALWEKFNEACEYRPLSTLAETAEQFANFEAV